MRRIIVAVLFSILAIPIHAMNTIIGIDSSIYESNNIVTIELDTTIEKFPIDFFLQSKNKIILDFENTQTRLPRKNPINIGDIDNISIIKTEDRVRLIISTKKESVYSIRIENNIVKIDINTTKNISITSDKSAEELIIQIRSIIKDGTALKDSIELLNSLLLLPSNEYTEEAQELIGIIYERTKQYERAKAENKIFLALYPNSKNYRVVKERLIALEIAEPKQKINIEDKKPRVITDNKLNVSIAEYFIADNTVQHNGSKQKQLSLVSNIRFDNILKYNQYDVKLAYRQSKLNNLTNSSLNKDIVTLAYIDLQDTYNHRDIRIGRQNAVHGSTGRFDGILTDLDLTSSSKLYLLAGSPYTGRTGIKKSFYGSSIETTYNDNLSSEIYYNYQIAENIKDRNAIGGIVRYNTQNLAFMSSIEYDFLYKAINAFTLQSTLYYKDYSLYVLSDIRKSPTLYSDKALMLGINSDAHIPYTSIKYAFTNSGLKSDDIYNYIRESTATNSAYAIGIGKQLNNIWNTVLTYQTNSLSSTEDLSFTPSIDKLFSVVKQPSTGSTKSLTLSVLGTDVITKGHSVNAFILHSSNGKYRVNNTYTLVSGIQLLPWRFDFIIMHANNRQESIININNTYSLRVYYKFDYSTIEVQLTNTDILSNNKVSLDIDKSHIANIVFGWKVDF